MAIVIERSSRSIVHRRVIRLAQEQSALLDKLFAGIGSNRRNVGLYAIINTRRQQMIASRTISTRRLLAQQLRKDIIEFSEREYKIVLNAGQKLVNELNALYMSYSTFTFDTVLEWYITFADEDDLNFWDVYLAFINGQFSQLALGGFTDQLITLYLNPSIISIHFTNLLTQVSSSANRAKKTDKVEWRKQAVAVIDKRTTDCCRKVNGDIVSWSDKFHLVGEPRYADYMDWPPFHNWCRTVCVPIPASFVDGGVLQELYLL